MGAGARHAADVIVGEADAVNHHRVVVETAQPLQQVDARLDLGVETFLEVGDEWPALLLRKSVFTPHPAAPR